MKLRALLGRNKYEVMRGIWKEVTAPTLTFANAILWLKSHLLSGLELITKGRIGRMALKAHGKTTNEALKVDMVWASPDVTEAKLVLNKYSEQWIKRNRWLKYASICT